MRACDRVAAQGSGRHRSPLLAIQYQRGGGGEATRRLRAEDGFPALSWGLAYGTSWTRGAAPFSDAADG